IPVCRRQISSERFRHLLWPAYVPGLSHKLLLFTMIIERSRDQVRYLIVAAELVSAGRTGWDKPTPYAG
ncbi:MAG: hypothetical protein AB1744_13410, partial [Candidatus Zixiibacteriota bacterium]